MKPVLIYLRPLDQTTGQRIDVRVADGPSADVYGTAGQVWDAAMLTRPTLSIELMSPEMDGGVQAGQARFDISLNNVSVARALKLYWRGAAVVIHSTGVLEGATAVPDFWGYVTSARINLETGALAVTAEVSTALIDKPLLTGEFTGGGGIGGDAAKRGVLYPAGFGTVKNIQPTWFDLTRNIGMIDGYANTLSIDWLGEGLSSFGARVADYPTYDALAAAIDNKTIKPGQWGTCVAQGLVGLGAPPTGIITVHATFGTNRIGAMMKRMLLTHAQVPAARVDGPAFDALDALVPLPVHFWTDQQRNVKDLLQSLAQSCNATPLVSFQNLVTVTRAIGGAIVGTLDRSGAIDPRVIDWQSADVDPPYYLLKARAARPASVLTDDQVNFVDTLEDKGVYAAATVYRAGNLVWLADGSQWLYQNATPASGHAPPSGAAPDGKGYVQDAWWFRRQPPKTASDFTYNDGTPIEALKPRQIGSDVTASNTANAIANQGPGATAPGAQVLNSFLSILANGQFQGGGGGQVTYGGLGGKAVGLQDAISFGSSYLLESVGGAIATLALFKTLLGTANAITNQGSLATLSSVTSSYVGFQVGGGNVVLNSSFEKAALQFNVDYFSWNTGAPAATWATTTAAARTGTQAARGVVQAGGAADADHSYALRWENPSVPGAEKGVAVSAWFYGAQGDAVGIRVVGMTAAGVNYGVVDHDNRVETTLSAGNSWQRVVVKLPAKAGRTGVHARFYPAGNPAANRVVTLDDVQIEIGDVETAYAPRVDEILPGVVGRPQLAYNAATFGTNVVRADGSTSVTDALAITSLGTAAALLNQGALATLSSLAYGSSYLSGFAAMATRARVALGDGYVFRADGSTALTDALAVTSLGTAAALLNQGALATLSALALGSSYLTGFGSLAGKSQVGGGNMIPNSSFEDTLNPILGWTAGNGGAQISITSTSTAARSGTKCLRATLNATSTDVGSGNFSQATHNYGVWYTNDAIGIVNGPVVFSAWVLGTTGRYVVIRAVRNVNGTSQYTALNADYTSALILQAGWNRIQVSLPVWDRATYGDCNGLHMRIGFGPDAAAGDVLYVDDVQLEVGDTPTAYAAKTSELLTGSVYQGALANNAVRLGTNIVLADNATVATDSLLRTSLGTAAAIANQGALATKSQAAYGSDVSGIPYVLTTANMPYQDGAYRLRADASVYGDGVYVQNRQPAEAGANITENRTANAISNQGAFATKSSVGYGSSFLTGFGALAPLGAINFGSSYLLEASGGAQASLANFKTSLGTASGITNQGSLATQSSVTWRSQFSGAPAYVTDPYTGGSGNLIQAGYVYLGNGQAARNMFDYFPATTGSDKTGNANAAGIANQGALATLSNLAYGGPYLSNFGGLAGRSLVGGNNFVVNGSFEDTSYGVAPWFTYGYAQLSITTSDSHSGSRCMMVYVPMNANVADGNSDVSQATHYFGAWAQVSVPPSTVPTTLSCWVKGTAGKRIVLRIYNDDYSAGAQQEFVLPDSNWRQWSITLGSLSKTTTLYGWRVGPGTGTAGGDYVLVDDVKFEFGDVPTAFDSRLSKLTLDGRPTSGQGLNPSNNFGLRSLSDAPSIYDSLDGNGNLYINVGQFSVYGDWGSAVTYPGGTIGPVSYSTQYYIWRNVSGPADAGSSYGYSTNVGDALGVDKVYFGRITTRAQGGAGSTGGGYGDPNCVAADAWFLTTAGVVRGYDLTTAHRMVILRGDGTLGEHEVEACEVASSLSCELDLGGGYRLPLALNTDMPIAGGGYVLAANAWGHEIPVLANGVTHRTVEEVESLGAVDVVKMRCGDNVFFAGRSPDKLVASHNLPVNGNTYKP